MKSKYFISAALSGLFGLLVAFSASAQHRGGGGGGFHGGGGGGFHGGGGFSGGHSYGGGFHNSGGGSYSHDGSSSYGHSGSYSRGSSSYSHGGGYPQARGSAPRVNSQSYRGGGNRLSVNSQRSTVVSPGSSRMSYSRGYSNLYRGGGAYRGGYRGGYYNRSGYRGGYNRFYGHGAYYNRYYLPRLGFHLSVLPFGYYPFYWGDYQYFYSDGYYYQYDNDNYTVVEPPLGAIMGQLPSGAKSLLIDGEQYYELNGVYYQAVTKDDGSTGYQIAGKDGELSTGASAGQQDNGNYNNQPSQGNSNDQGALKIGDIVDNLPANCNTVKIDGQRYYVSPDGIYYQDDRDGNQKVYRVAGTPEDQPGN